MFPVPNNPMFGVTPGLLHSCPQEFGALRRGWSIPWLVRGWFAHAIDSVAGCENAIA